MNKPSISRIVIFSLLILGFGTGCGLATSDEERIARAVEQMANGEYRAATIELKNVLASNENNVTARIMLARVSLGLGDLLSAEKELRRAADLNAAESDIRSIHLDILTAKRNFAEVLVALSAETGGLTQEQQWSYRGEALLGLGNADVARETYSEWLQSDPNAAGAQLGLASADLLQGDAASAINRLVDITVTNPADDHAWQLLGGAYFRRGDYDNAESALLKAAEMMKPQSDVRRYANVLVGLTETQMALDKREDAHRNLERLTGIAPQAPATLFLAARLARSEGDYALASRDLQMLLNVSPDNIQAQIFLANMQMLQSNFLQAERLLQRVVAISPDNLQARKLLARVQLQQSRPGGAIEALAPALESNQVDSDIYTILAQASLQEGDKEAAIRRFRSAVELAPNETEAKLNLAAAYLDADDAELAMEVLSQVPEGAGILRRREQLLMLALVAQNRTTAADRVAEKLIAEGEPSERIVIVVANHYLRTNRDERARIVLRDLVVKNSDVYAGRNLLARIEMSMGNFDTAHSLYLEVLAADKSNLSALMGLARVSQQAGDDAEFQRLLEVAANEHADALGPRIMLARKQFAMGDSAEAEHLANEMVAIGFRSAYVSEIVANIYADVGRNEDALYQFQQALALNSESRTIQFGMARTFLSLNRSVEAREALNRALEISPDWPLAMLQLALVEIRQGQLDDALSTVEKLREMHPDNVTGMILEGEVRLYKQEFSMAAEAFARAVANGAGRSSVLRQYQAQIDGDLLDPARALSAWLTDKPDDTVVRSFLAQHFHNGGDGERAISEYEQVLKYTPNSVTVMNNLAWQYQQSGNLERAVELAEAAHEISPESGSIADTLAWIYRDIGQLEKSSDLLSNASRLAPNNGEILFHYAVILIDTGEKEKARQILKTLKNDDVQFPSRQQADSLLGEL